LNLAEVLFETADSSPESLALTDLHNDDSVTYGALAEAVQSLAGIFREQGVLKGQRIGLEAPNTTGHVVAAFALLATGACVVPVAPGIGDGETARLLREIRVNALLSWPGARRQGQRLTDGPCEGYVLDWTDREAEAPTGFAESDPAFVRFTSGTTGASKGVILSHAGTLERAAAAAQALQLTRADRIGWVLPLAYHFAATMTSYVRVGAHVLLCPETNPGALVDALRRSEATVLYASPLHFDRLRGLESRRGPLPALRLAISTTASLPAGVREAFERLYDTRVGQAYGLIEAGLPCINTGQDGLAPESVGRPSPGYEMTVLGEEGRPLPKTEVGEIAVRGPGLFSGYFSPWLAREDVVQSGFFRTGDLGFVDHDGSLHLEGRKKSCLNVAGVKVFPEEIESWLDAFPGVRESRVSARDHHRLGQVPVAEVVLEPGHTLDALALRTHCALELSSFKIPIEFTEVASVPRTPGGKILRRAQTE
jgi:long-chain acyl-CoA synthetase